jgi:hypothetical protein
MEVLSRAVGAGPEGLKRVAALLQFVYKRYGLEKASASDGELASIVASLGLADPASAKACCERAAGLVQEVVRGSFVSLEQLAAVTGRHTSDAAVAQALAQIIQELQGGWKAVTVSTQVSLPRLKSVDWRVDVKTASSHAAGMGVPSVIVAMQVEGGKESTVVFEMDKETLSALLSGLGKIRNQLAGLN